MFTSLIKVVSVVLRWYLTNEIEYYCYLPLDLLSHCFLIKQSSTKQIQGTVKGQLFSQEYIFF